MAFTRYAAFDTEILDIKGSPVQHRTASLDKLSDFESYRTDDGYMYVRIRAISSRVNKNHDGWPSIELAGSPEIFDRHQSAEGGFTVEAADGNKEYGFATFVGKPVFVDHNNSNPRKARGIIVDAKFNVLDQRTASGDDYWKSADTDKEHLPACEVELLLEVDAQSYPKFAKRIIDGDLDGFSMGANVEYTKCSHCGKVAHDLSDFCSHVLMKGAHHDFKTADGKTVTRRSYENCYKVAFFEISGVFDPADETALAREVRAGVQKEGEVRGLMDSGDPELAAGYGVKPDPIWDNRDPAVEQEAHRLQQEYGYDPEKALEVAQHVHLKNNPLPGASDGPSAGGVVPPSGFTPLPGDPSALDAVRPPEPTRMSSAKEAQNPLPQEMMTRAPDEVDTLRDEQTCPVCGSDMDDETCKVCGYVSPPAEFDNPDLTKAQGIRDEMAEKDQQQTQQDQQPMNPLQPQNGPGAGGPLTGRGRPQPSKVPVAASVTNDMRWTPQVHPKTAARINKTEVPVRTSGQPTSNEPSTETVLSDQTRPVTAAMLTARRLMAAANTTGDHMNHRTADGPTPPGDTSPKTRVDVVGVGGVDQASNEEASKAQTQTDVTGVGGLGVTDVAADKTESLPAAGRDSDDSGFNTDKTTEDSGPTKTFGDSDGTEKGITDPVTSDPFPASEDGVKSAAHEDGTLEQQEQQGNEPVAQGGSAVQGVQPVDSVATDSYKRVNLLEHQTTPSNNSGPTDTWSGTDGNGVLKQQDPVTQDKMEWGGVPTPDVQLHTTGAMKTAFINAERLASLEVKLGLAAEDAKPNRMAELMDANPIRVAERLATLEQVKTAGAAKLAKTAGVTAVPRLFGKATSHNFERIASEAPERESVDDTLLDSALFGR